MRLSVNTGAIRCTTRVWVHEVKYDGYRFQAHIHQGQVRFFTRRGYDWTARLAKLVAPAARLKAHAAILDGEAVVQDENGHTDFNELEREISRKGSSKKLIFYVFDLLYLEDLDLRPAPLVERKQVLEELISTLEPGGPIVFSEHVEADGPELWQQARALGLEGIVSKRKDARYQSGRIDTWTKTPCKRRETFVILGWAEKGTRFDGFSRQLIALSLGKARDVAYVHRPVERRAAPHLHFRLQLRALPDRADAQQERWRIGHWRSPIKW
jgi:bifunctional non-homologous end joining protein LigD